MTFEEALARLEEVVAILEKGELSLDTALAAFQEGMKFLRICITKLTIFEEQIEIALNDYYSEIPSWLRNQKREEN
jgi:exodeoxyribonuclease VII small subunit